MKFGIQHGMGDPNWKREILHPNAVIKFAQGIEHAGFSHLGFTDHPAPSGRWIDNGGEGVADPFTSLGFCAAVTSHIRLVTWTLVLPFHNPLATAHRIATLDALSNGRLTLGLGLGYLKSEFFAVGADFDNRHAVFDQNLEVIQQALSGDDVFAVGPNFSAKGIRIEPPVVQTPHPPLWFYGNSDFGLQRAAQQGEGWIGMFTTDQVVSTIRTTPMPDLNTLSLRLKDLDAQLALNGRSRSDLEIVITAAVPHIDARNGGWNKDQYQQRFGELKELGVDTVIVNAIGDDPEASLDSALHFADDFISSR